MIDTTAQEPTTEPISPLPAAPMTTAAPSATIVASPAPSAPPKGRGAYLWGTGRRKSSVARVRLAPGDGKFQINGRNVEKYFTEPLDRNDVLAPLVSTGAAGKWNIVVRVHGGGHTGQAGAIKLGVARALVQANPEFEPTLRDNGYLTRDAREVERKKYGRRKARRRFQFSKR